MAGGPDGQLLTILIIHVNFMVDQVAMNKTVKRIVLLLLMAVGVILFNQFGKPQVQISKEIAQYSETVQSVKNELAHAKPDLMAKLQVAEQNKKTAEKKQLHYARILLFPIGLTIVCTAFFVISFRK